MERRSNDDDKSSRQHSNPDIFHDDYELDPEDDEFMPVLDGFRPGNATTTSNERSRHDRNDAPPRPSSTSKPSSSGAPDLRRTATRNSTTKARDSTIQDNGPHPSRRTITPSPFTNRDSVSSIGSFATTTNSDDPFRSGPSHPYGMYPQHTIARPLSIVTNATNPTSQQAPSLQRPTHPYAMYSQSGLVDEEIPEELARPRVPQVQSAVPIGFRGLSTGYHRQLGPDGEEQDIVGPDGHTEQLPPYSSHPVEGPTKASLAAEASAARVVPAPVPLPIPLPTPQDSEDLFTSPISPISPSSPVSFLTPALASTPLLPPVAPARLPQPRPETQSGSMATASSTYVSIIPAEPSDSSSASLLTTENFLSDKEELEPPKRSWFKRRVWGKVSIGLVVASVALILILGVVIGAAIGRLVAKQQHSDKATKERNRQHEQAQPQLNSSNATYFDAVPIPPPPGLPPIPTGSFALPLGIPQEGNPSCLTQPNQFAAWSCRMTFAPLIITINDTNNNDGTHQAASIKSSPLVSDSAIMYGLQTPRLDSLPLRLVLDLDFTALGPAFHFWSLYNKVVILRPEELIASTGKRVVSKRQNDEGMRQRFLVRPGDKPWYCYWNDTYIEGYVYAQDNSTISSFNPVPSQASTNPPNPTGSAPPAATGPPNLRRDTPLDPAATLRIPPYPRIVKVEERRLPRSSQPSCQKMLMLDDGKLTPLQNDTDGPTHVWLQESDPSFADFSSAQASEAARHSRKKKRDLVTEFQKRTDPANSCHCQWMFR